MMLTSLTYFLELNGLNVIVVPLLTNDSGFLSLSAALPHRSLLESQPLSGTESYMLSAPSQPQRTSVCYKEKHVVV